MSCAIAPKSRVFQAAVNFAEYCFELTIEQKNKKQRRNKIWTPMVVIFFRVNSRFNILAKKQK